MRAAVSVGRASAWTVADTLAARRTEHTCPLAVAETFDCRRMRAVGELAFAAGSDTILQCVQFPYNPSRPERESHQA